MEEADDDIAERVQALSDIELAVLLCLITAQHCIIETDNELLHDLDQELRLVCVEMCGETLYTDHHRSRSRSLGSRGRSSNAPRRRRWMILALAFWPKMKETITSIEDMNKAKAK